MYEAARDPYCYDGTDVLKNKADLTSPQDLQEFETAMTFARSEEPLPAGRLSVSHFKNITTICSKTCIRGRANIGRFGCRRVKANSAIRKTSPGK